MFITTESKDNEYWKTFSVFDTDTGVRYSLQTRQDFQYISERDAFVSLSITSVNTPGGEYTGGVYYENQEAIDFWRELIKIDVGVEFINSSANAAGVSLARFYNVIKRD